METDVLKQRIKHIGGAHMHEGKCVLYVMSRDQHVKDNHALLAAQKHALAKKLPLAVVFCLVSITTRAREHYEFMLEGLKQVEQVLATKNIPFMMVFGEPVTTLQGVFHHTEPDAVYFDLNPLRSPRAMQAKLAETAKFPLYVVDTHNTVPLWVASPKREVGAYTMRPKLHKTLGTFLVEPEQIQKHPHNWPGTVKPLADLKEHIQRVVDMQKSNSTKLIWKSGEAEAARHLEEFIKNGLEQYGEKRNIPTISAQSNLSPYLHFGQISAMRVTLRLQEESAKSGRELHLLHSPKMPKPEDTNNTRQYSIDALLEELIVRKELADNYCNYCDDYDNLGAAADWAKRSLDSHRSDAREHLYAYEQLVAGNTHDDLWNLAQKQLTVSGKMHGYLRMYWAKKVLEWTESPEQAIAYLVKMNDFFSIDGGDPNGYAGILWSVAGVHDRPWFDRPIFGLIRYMGYESLKKKFN